MSDLPKTCKDWKGKKVIVTRVIRNRGGDIFYPGDRLIVSNRRSDGTFLLTRPKAKVELNESDGDFVLDPEQLPFSVFEVDDTAK